MKNKIKADLLQARKDKDDIRKSILSVLIGEIQLDESRSGKDADDSSVVKHIKKLKKSCDEMAERGNADSKAESEILLSYLPKEMTVAEIILAIRNEDGLWDEIVTAENRMRLMGKVRKVLDKSGTPYDGKILSITLQQLS